MCENLGAIEMLEDGIKLLDFVNTAMNLNLGKNSNFFDQMKYYQMVKDNLSPSMSMMC
jgi:hypothetical protein